MQVRALWLLVGVLSWLAAHGVARTAALNEPQTAQDAVAAAVSGRETIHTGRILGTVRTERPAERPAPLRVHKNRGFCGPSVPDESLLVSPTGAVQNVVVTLDGRGVRKKRGRPQRLVLDNRNCAFVPHVQVAPAGSEILLRNSDPILHDVHAFLGTETLFNVGLPSWRRVTKRLTRPGVVAVECEVLHTWMTAYIVVTFGPHFAVTDEGGEFVLGEIPSGRYTLEAWHEKLGRQSTEVVVTEGRTSRVDLVLPRARKGEGVQPG